MRKLILIALLALSCFCIGMWFGYAASLSALEEFLPPLRQIEFPPNRDKDRRPPMAYQRNIELLQASFQQEIKQESAVPSIDLEAPMILADLEEYYQKAPPNTRIEMRKLYEQFPFVTVFSMNCVSQCFSSKKFVLFSIKPMQSKKLDNGGGAIYWQGPARLFYITITYPQNTKTYRLDTVPAMPLIFQGEEEQSTVRIIYYRSQDLLRMLYPDQKEDL